MEVLKKYIMLNYKFIQLHGKLTTAKTVAAPPIYLSTRETRCFISLSKIGDFVIKVKPSFNVFKELFYPYFITKI